MIQANELRIGNWIHETCFNEDRIIEGVANETIYLNNKFGRHFSYYELLPIPLTPEILIACGFDSIQNEDENCNINYTLTKNTKWWIQFHTDVNEYIFYGINNSIELPIKYLHQLQNLYFALTGKELIINL